MFKNARKVHIDGQIYYWKKGTENCMACIWIQTPDGRRFHSSYEEVTVLSSEQIDEFMDAGYFHIGPGKVKAYIEEHIHAKD